MTSRLELSRPAAVEPKPSPTPEQAPKKEGGRGAELTSLKGVDPDVDQTRINQRATDPPAQHPGDQKADGLEIAGHGGRWRA